MENGNFKKDVEKSSLRLWAMTAVFLLLAFKGIYLQKMQTGTSKNKRMVFLHELIELLRLCLIIRSLAEQLLA